MGLYWDWSDKIGSVIYDDGSASTLYKGNAYIIAVNHLPDDFYNLAWFASDREHMKNMLGLNRGFDNVFKGFGIKEIHLDTARKETAQIVQDLAKSKTPITIVLF